MMRCSRLAAAVVILAGLGLGSRALAESPVVLPRPGQVGLGVQGGYGTWLDNGNVGSEFGAGPTLAVRLRYRARYERGIGLSFEGQQFEARTQVPLDPLNPQPEKLSSIASGLEVYQFFGTRTKTTKMIMVGVGIDQLRVKLNDGETELSGPVSGDGLYVSAGAGLERFFFRSVAWDLSGRYLAVFRNGETNHNFQAALGLIFYASY